jgi:DNA-binding LacI/PurR family transcriptional regulator
MPTIKDVAREAGVSIATVSYVLNNKPGSVSKKTREEVLNAIDRVGYTPNTTARNLKSSQTRLIGYAWHETPQHDQVNAVLDRFTYFMAQAAEAAGYHLLTFTHPADDPIPVYDEMIRTGRVDAFVLAGTALQDERIQFLMEVGFPFVSFGRSNAEWDFPWVDTDGYAGMTEAVRYLVGLGHERIALAAWPEDSLAGRPRLQGYLDTMRSAGLGVNPDYVIRGEHSEPAGHHALTQWLSLPAPEIPTAVIGISDLVAIGMMNEATRRGLHVGYDLSVIGFDDAPLTRHLNPPLTTVEQPIPEIGQAMMHMLERILCAEPLDHQGLLVPPRLIIRESCGPVCSI